MRPSRGGESPLKVVILGAGITGLVAARELTKAAAGSRRPIEVVVLEASARVGGKVRTESLDGAVVETGPDSFITTKPEMLELVRELGLESDLIGTAPDPTVFVLKDGRLVPIPAGTALISPTRFWPFALSSLFSWKAKLRMAVEPLISARADGADESLADFARRRLGDEALGILVGPMLAGIFAGDPERLSARSTFPQLLEAEKKGGLLKALWFGGAGRRATRDGITTFMTLKGGLTRVIEALAVALPPRAVLTDCPAQGVRRRGARWEILTPRGPIEADALISALPASAAADAFESHDPELAMRLREIPFASTATATAIYDAASLPRPLRGFGFLAPRGEGRAVTAATFSSAKFPARAPKGRVVVRAFVGGAGREELAEGAITRLEDTVKRELDQILGLGGAKPLAFKTARWIKANPQYDVGHSRRLDRLSSCLKSHPGLVLAGSSYGGVGLPDCVKSGRRAAEMSLSAHRRNHDAVRPGLA